MSMKKTLSYFWHAINPKRVGSKDRDRGKGADTQKDHPKKDRANRLRVPSPSRVAVKGTPGGDREATKWRRGLLLSLNSLLMLRDDLLLDVSRHLFILVEL